MSATYFVERQFFVQDQAVVVRCETPFKAAGGEFQCCWSIKGGTGEFHGYACGEDGVQALMLALQSVRLKLEESDAFKKGLLTLWGQTDLDLPPSWGHGPLYYGSFMSPSHYD